jgi:hypothetical protein
MAICMPVDKQWVLLTSLLSNSLERGHDLANIDTPADSHCVSGGVYIDIEKSGDVDHDCVLDAVKRLGPPMTAVPSEDLAVGFECILDLFERFMSN